MSSSNSKLANAIKERRITEELLANGLNIPDLSPTSGRRPVDPRSLEAQSNPDLRDPLHPFRKGGDILPGMIAPANEDQEVAPSGDTIIINPSWKATDPEDYVTPEYDYGDKLPKNRGIPIPVTPPEVPARTTYLL